MPGMSPEFKARSEYTLRILAAHHAQRRAEMERSAQAWEAWENPADMLSERRGTRGDRIIYSLAILTSLAVIAAAIVLQHADIYDAAGLVVGAGIGIALSIVAVVIARHSAPRPGHAPEPTDMAVIEVEGIEIP